MNLKKFISGVSALTIAASAFAGLAVTANASATEHSLDVSQYAQVKITTSGDEHTPVVTTLTKDDTTNVNGYSRSNGVYWMSGGYVLAKYDLSSSSNIVKAELSTTITYPNQNTTNLFVTDPTSLGDWKADDLVATQLANYREVKGTYGNISEVGVGSNIYNNKSTTKNRTATITYDVSNSVVGNTTGYVTFLLATTTGRQTQIDTAPVLKVTTVADGEHYVTISSNAADATFTIDGNAVTGPVVLADGVHTWSATADGYISKTDQSFTRDCEKFSVNMDTNSFL